jgi:hypothetical protein
MEEEGMQKKEKKKRVNTHPTLILVTYLPFFSNLTHKTKTGTAKWVGV